jgi:hypothetical protein
MPNDVKAIVSVMTLLVAFGFAHYERAYGKPHLYWFVIALAVFAVVAMWIFPEAGVKKGDMPAKKRDET